MISHGKSAANNSPAGRARIVCVRATVLVLIQINVEKYRGVNIVLEKFNMPDFKMLQKKVFYNRALRKHKLLFQLVIKPNFEAVSPGLEVVSSEQGGGGAEQRHVQKRCSAVCTDSAQWEESIQEE